jgi:hypothetical protein
LYAYQYIITNNIFHAAVAIVTRRNEYFRPRIRDLLGLDFIAFDPLVLEGRATIDYATPCITAVVVLPVRIHLNKIFAQLFDHIPGLVVESSMDVIDGSLESASPCPPEN